MARTHTIDGTTYTWAGDEEGVSGRLDFENDTDEILSNEYTDADGNVVWYHTVDGNGGDDIITVISDRREYTKNFNNTGDGNQRHVYGDQGDDTINIAFASNAEGGFHQGIHANGGLGDDVFNFQDVHNITEGMVYTGRFEDFDPSSDEIQVDGMALDLNDLSTFNSENPFGATARVVEFNGAMRDDTMPPQQWLLIEINGGYIFYTLESARFDPVRYADTVDNEGGPKESEFIF